MAKRHVLVALAITMAAAGCVPTPKAPMAPPPPPPAPASAPAPAPPPPADWRGIQLTPGGWRYDGATLTAAFGPTGGAVLFTIRCDRAERQVILARPDLASGAMIVRTSSSQRSLPVPAALATSDSFLDELAFSRGRFTVEATGLTILVIPAWAEPARVVDDCRR